MRFLPWMDHETVAAVPGKELDDMNNRVHDRHRVSRRLPVVSLAAELQKDKALTFRPSSLRSERRRRTTPAAPSPPSSASA